ncbi:transporter [Actinoallomurus bryophytorum]|uniref:ABC-2 family transporter n=1 Tax=Actinoallomurus bryophytorum TaxID=1490222 RepID=A0A543C0V3_9ACTN|nr:transporter [Actinoallomurus bryophytorum]TQL90713.1 hypothetical protein FB559_8026 [Actinoallomurus bryophytorum]
MIWLTWRQLRTQAAVVFGLIAVLAVLLAATGPRLAGRYGTDSFLSEIGGADTALYLLGALALLALPFVIGMFWGAPMIARELEAGTHRLVWTQGSTRTRWLLTKLGLTGLTAMAAAGLLSLAVTWWSGPIDRAIADASGAGAAPGPGLLIFPRLSPEIFDSRGIVPLGYAAFAFVLGVTVGVIVARILPAMAIVLALLAVTQITMSVGVRPHLETPERLTTTITATNILRIDRGGHLTLAIDRPGAWSTAQRTVNASGRTVRPPSWMGDCLPGPGQRDQGCFARLEREGYRQVVTYQPAGRFWAIQRDEALVYLALALLLAGLCAWWTRHRLS